MTHPTSTVPPESALREEPSKTAIRRLRVLSLSQLYPGAATAGQGVFVHERLRHLPRKQAEVEVWRLRPRFPGMGGVVPPASEELDGIRVLDRPYWYLPRWFKGLDGPVLAQQLGRRDLEGFDVLDAHFGYPAGWASATVGARLGIPSVITFRGSEVPFATEPARRRRLSQAVQRASGIIAVSSVLADLAVELGAARNRVHVIGNGIDASTFMPGDRQAARERLGLPLEGRCLLTVGGLTPRKGIGRVIEVLPRLVAEEPDLRYLIVGGGGPEGDHRAELEAQVAGIGLEDHVVFLGPRGREELPDLYRAADAFVLATQNEGWANVLHEALASGIPVVTTEVGGNRQVLGDGAHGILVPFGDADALGAGIARALAGEVDVNAASAFARARTWDVVGEETLEVLGAVR